jgi:hypothetical protein
MFKFSGSSYGIIRPSNCMFSLTIPGSHSDSMLKPLDFETGGPPHQDLKIYMFVSAVYHTIMPFHVVPVLKKMPRPDLSEIISSPPQTSRVPASSSMFCKLQVISGKPVTLTRSQNNLRRARQLGTPRLSLAPQLRPRVLRHRNDAPLDAALRSRPTRHHLSCVTSTGRCDDRCWHGYKQDCLRGAAVL